jgi:hypothetical protein
MRKSVERISKVLGLSNPLASIEEIIEDRRRN